MKAEAWNYNGVRGEVTTPGRLRMRSTGAQEGERGGGQRHCESSVSFWPGSHGRFISGQGPLHRRTEPSGPLCIFLSVSLSSCFSPSFRAPPFPALHSFTFHNPVQTPYLSQSHLFSTKNGQLSKKGQKWLLRSQRTPNLSSKPTAGLLVVWPSLKTKQNKTKAKFICSLLAFDVLLDDSLCLRLGHSP